MRISDWSSDVCSSDLYQAMLLAGDTDAEDALAVDSGGCQGLMGRLGERVQPLRGILLAPPVLAADHGVGSRTVSQDLTAGCVQDQRLGALGDRKSTRLNSSH